MTNVELRARQDSIIEELRDDAIAAQRASLDMYRNAGRVREFYNNNRSFMAERGHLLNGNPATASYLANLKAAARYKRQADAYNKLADDIEKLYKEN